LPQVNPTHDLWENEKEVWMDGQYFTEIITEKCIEYLRKMNSESKPFFLYVPYNAPHYPMHAPKKYMDRFSNLPWDRQVMAAMLSAMDDSVGNIMDELKRLGVDDNTLTFFTSDNGPSRETRNWLDSTLDPYYGGTAGKFKGHKGSLFEGGIREPGIMHWPGNIQTGVVSSEPCASMDIAPTILEAAGVNLDDHYLDGKSLVELAKGNDNHDDRVIFWEYLDQTAVRKGKWKLVLKGKLIDAYGPVPDVHLANLEEDISESNNLADKEPEITAELTKLAENWRSKIEDKWIKDYGAPSEAQRLNTQMGLR
jgi:arylsulfatase A-like enzyme